jgi:hypothetical protein
VRFAVLLDVSEAYRVRACLEIAVGPGEIEAREAAQIRFKLDENIPGDAAALLRVAGHEVQSVIDEHLEGTPDA